MAALPQTIVRAVPEDLEVEGVRPDPKGRHELLDHLLGRLGRDGRLPLAPAGQSVVRRDLDEERLRDTPVNGTIGQVPKIAAGGGPHRVRVQRARAGSIPPDLHGIRSDVLDLHDGGLIQLRW